MNRINIRTAVTTVKIERMAVIECTHRCPAEPLARATKPSGKRPRI
jgi:hypothetical protein